MFKEVEYEMAKWAKEWVYDWLYDGYTPQDAMKAKKESDYWKNLGIENIEGNEDWANAKDAA